MAFYLAQSPRSALSLGHDLTVGSSSRPGSLHTGVEASCSKSCVYFRALFSLGMSAAMAQISKYFLGLLCKQAHELALVLSIHFALPKKPGSKFRLPIGQLCESGAKICWRYVI